MAFWYPDRLYDRLPDITLQTLQAFGATAVLLDVDNTLTFHHSQVVPPETMAWLEKMKAAGIRLTIVSNARKSRVQPFADKLGLSYISLACKPFPFGFLRAVKALGLKKTACIAVGDQTFTDVIGARLAGVPVIQLLPIEPETGWNFRWRRALEKRILARYQQKQTERR
ncbi:MAG: YqeG family HAD IIIA-type phosphatase [Clostridia bacterium]|nr:YqeG family HAD IIIA-type phosphatase [Clostridia bacterium]